MANDHVKMFTEEYGSIAEQVSKQTGIAPSVLLAQWGMETGYGTKVPGHFNFGNIKDVSGGGTEAVDNKTKSKDKYVNFESPEAFGDYYANLMRRLYPNALNTGSDIAKYAEGLRTGVKGSYAEDENYENAIRGAHKVTSNFYSDPKAEELEADKIRREDEEKKRNAPPKPVVDELDPMVGAVAGAAANSILPIFFDPKISPKIDTSRAQEANIAAQDKLELAGRSLERAAPQGAGDIEEQFRQSQGQLEQLKNEQKLAEARLKGLPKAPPAMEVPAPPASIDEPPRTKSGASGAVNYVNAMSDDVPEVLANQALNMRKDNPRGGQAIIDANTRAIQKQADLGMGDYGMTRTAGGMQMILPPTSLAERQAQIDQQAQASQAELQQRTEQARIQQEAQARQLEQQRLTYEAEIERIRQQRAQAGQRNNSLTGQVKDASRLQRSLTTAETDAELAQRRLARANQQPTAAGRMFEGIGVGSAKMGALPRALVGAGAGYFGVMSYQDAMARFKAGDTSEGVLKALEAGAAGAAMLPPAGKTLTKLRGAGLGGLGIAGGVELGRRLLRERPPEQ